MHIQTVPKVLSMNPSTALRRLGAVANGWKPPPAAGSRCQRLGAVPDGWEPPPAATSAPGRPHPQRGRHQVPLTPANLRLDREHHKVFRQAFFQKGLPPEAPFSPLHLLIYSILLTIYSFPQYHEQTLPFVPTAASLTYGRLLYTACLYQAQLPFPYSS